MTHGAKEKWKSPFYPRLSTCDNVMIQNAWKEFTKRSIYTSYVMLDHVFMTLFIGIHKKEINLYLISYGWPCIDDFDLGIRKKLNLYFYDIHPMMIKFNRL